MIINVASIMCGLLVFLAVYRLLMSSTKVQHALHACFPRFAIVLQYYSLLYIFLAALIVETVIYVSMDMQPVLISPEAVHKSLNETLASIPSMTQDERDHWVKELRFHDDLHQFALCSPVAALLAFIVSLYHVLRIMLEHNSNELEWFPTKRQDWVLQIMALPAVYGTMSLRCVLRCWALCSGRGWTSELAANGWTWAEFAEQNMDEYGANFALANFAEMYTLLCFSQLIVDLLKEAISSPELREAFSSLTMQGVLVFVVTGFTRVLVTLWLTFLRAYGRDTSHQHSHGVLGVPLEKEISMLTRLDTFLQYSVILTSLQALYNIKMVCELSPLQEINPSMKFLGTRILVIFAQLQSFCLQMGSAHGLFPINLYQAKLLHASLMCVECFGVSILHLFAWPDVDYTCGYLPLEDNPSARKPRRGSRFDFMTMSSRVGWS